MIRTKRLLTHAVLVISLVLIGCRNKEEQRLGELLDLEEQRDKAVSSQRIEELQRDIQQFRTVVEQKVEAAGNLASFYKLLALEYIDQRMYGLALDSLRSAIEIEPGNNILLYLAAVAAGNIAKYSVAPDSPPDEYLQLAERYYQEALEIDDEYSEARYGLAILYLFELDRPQEARPYVEQLLAEDSRDPNYLALQARMYAALGDNVRAAELYEQVARYARDEQTRSDAERNRNVLLEVNEQ